MELGEEAKSKWGKSEAYEESQRRIKNYTKDDWAEINSEARKIYEEFYENRFLSSDSKEISELVEKWQNHISKYFYECSPYMLKSLGELYASDKRYQNTMDEVGIGTAKAIINGIYAYCK